MSPLSLSVRVERWPIAGSFAISRGAKTEAVVVVAELSDGSHRGRGECVPYARYGETVEGVAAAIEAMAPDIARGLDRERLQSAMAGGAARNALDCAFWDLAAKRAARPGHELLGLAAPKPLPTALTISLATPHAMAQAAAPAPQRALLQVKLGAPGDPARIPAGRRCWRGTGRTGFATTPAASPRRRRRCGDETGAAGAPAARCAPTRPPLSG